VDQSLLDAGAAREFVNRVQKLRKSAGLQASVRGSVRVRVSQGSGA